MADSARTPSPSSQIAPRPANREGVWIHRSDAVEVLARKIDAGVVDDTTADQLRSLIERGYAHLPAAVAPVLVDRYAALFDSVWDAPPRGLQYIDDDGVVGSLTAAERDRTVRVVSLHLHSGDGPDLVFPAAVQRLLAAVYDRPPVCFQSMSFRHGSQQPIHLDTAYLPLSHDPLALMASWTALQDVEPGTGELVYYEGSHRIPEFRFGGRSKAVVDAPDQHAAFLEYLESECARRGLMRRTFTPRKGDVLVWTADLAHGGGKVTRPERLRRSFVCHFMPLGARPTFYDSSREAVVPYGHAFRLRRESEATSPLRRLFRVLVPRR